MFVPFLEITRGVRAHEYELQQSISRVLQSGRFILGAEVEFFEAEFAQYLGMPFASATASGTDALSLGLEAILSEDRSEKVEVLTSALSAAFTPLAIYHAGAVPRFVDIDPNTLQLSPQNLEELIGERTAGVVPVHLYGNACDIVTIAAIAQHHGLALLEDACQAHGTKIDGESVGSLSAAAAFSFYPTKNLGALGDAGILVSRDKELIDRVKKLRHGGQRRTYDHELLGRNSRMDELQAAILRSKLQHLDAQNASRRKIAALYDEAFSGFGITVAQTPGSCPNRHLYPIRTPQRDRLRSFLSDSGIETLVHYPLALPEQPAFRRFVLPGQQFEAARRAAREVLSLPLYPELSSEEVAYIIDRVSHFYKSCS